MDKDDKNKEVLPTPTSEETLENLEEETPEDQEDADFEKELESRKLDDEEDQPKRTELERAAFNVKSTIKRIRDLGGDPEEILADEIKPRKEVKPAADTNQFVTKTDLYYQEAEKMAQTTGELKLMKYWIDKGMTVSDAHHMANKGRITKIIGEINRTKSALPANAGGGPGADRPVVTDAPDLSQADKDRLIQSGMVYNQAKKAYIGTKIQHRYDETTKAWVTEKI